MMKCPRDETELKIEHYKGIEVDHCPACHGRWLDYGELDDLEALAAPDEDTRHATVEFAKRPSELKCPLCEKQMRAFNSRAYNLELDTCEAAPGSWLDVGDDGRVHDTMHARGRRRSIEAPWSACPITAFTNAVPAARGRSTASVSAVLAGYAHGRTPSCHFGSCANAAPAP